MNLVRECNECKKLLTSLSITDKKKFKFWALKNHPDKNRNVNEDFFKTVSNCNDMFFGTGINKKCFWEQDYKYTSVPKTDSKKKPKSNSSNKREERRRREEEWRRREEEWRREQEERRREEEKRKEEEKNIIKEAYLAFKEIYILNDKLAKLYKIKDKEIKDNKDINKLEYQVFLQINKINNARNLGVVFEPSYYLYVINPETGNLVIETGKIGQKVIKYLEKKYKRGYTSENSSSMKYSPKKKPSESKKTNLKPCDEDQIRNPKTNRCVKKSSPLGKKILKEMNKDKSGSRKSSSMKSGSRKSGSRKSSSMKSGSRKSSSRKSRLKPCNENQIRNPKTNRCVKKSSPLGKKILKEMNK